MSDALYDLTLVVPCYNEADNIPLFYKTAPSASSKQAWASRSCS